MPKAKPEPEDTRSQKQKFIDAAREHGADADEDGFRRIVRGIAKPPVDKGKKRGAKSKG